jgi:hypothetical protein
VLLTLAYLFDWFHIWRRNANTPKTRRSVRRKASS